MAFSGDLDQQLGVEEGIDTFAFDAAEADRLVCKKNMFGSNVPGNILEASRAQRGPNAAYSSTYTAIDLMFNLRQVAITRQAISPLLAMRTLRMGLPPSGNCATKRSGLRGQAPAVLSCCWAMTVGSWTGKPASVIVENLNSN